VETIDHVAAQTRLHLPTGLLNRTLDRAAARVAAPSREGGRRLHLYYAVQTRVAPVTVRLFVNQPDLATRPYLDYLVRSLREGFGLEGAPVVLDLQARTRPGETRSRPKAARSGRGCGGSRRPC
jgi:predicted GTPase